MMNEEIHWFELFESPLATLSWQNLLVDRSILVETTNVLKMVPAAKSLISRAILNCDTAVIIKGMNLCSSFFLIVFVNFVLFCF